MGQRFEQIMIDHSLSLLNNGELTYHLGQASSAVDITLTHGLNDEGPTNWRLIDDMLQTPHKGI